MGQILVDLNLGLGISHISTAPYAYRRAYDFMGMPGSIRWINKRALKAKYDPKDPASSDIDMMMQELMYNRIVLQSRYFCAQAEMDTNDGSSEDRSYHVQIQEAMKTKWGKYYGYDYRKNEARIHVER